jgi:hypothetical protein
MFISTHRIAGRIKNIFNLKKYIGTANVFLVEIFLKPNED